MEEVTKPAQGKRERETPEVTGSEEEIVKTTTVTTTTITTTTEIKQREEPIKVNKWNLSELKNACDDHVQKYLTTKAQYCQHHVHTDVKLFLGYVSCVFALVGGSYTYFTPFQESKDVTLVCVIAYLILNTLMVAYSLFVEKDTIFVGCPMGMDKNSEKYHKLIIHTTTKRYSDIYNITFEVKHKNDASRASSSINNSNVYTISRSYGGWFDVNGVLDTEIFEKVLAEGIRVALSGEKPHEQ
ncbi:5521_t:CDS:2 [Ambispora leptoticha]|uniref:Signal peptidase complex subunit 2 n=1 Tax=Ambispora leptoticha TaxID=144679 RepID=A0A9N8WGF9_9GLOM|nr:5521_t:CDS:2 [Ambispora leptoticha]